MSALLNFKKAKKFISFIAICSHLQCSGAQTSTSEAKVPKKVVKSEKVTPGTPTNLAIDAGSASGTELSIEDGALAEGTKVSLDRVVPPSEFAAVTVEFSSASSAIEVKAKNGSEDATTTSPMTLAIPYNNTALRLYLAEVERKIDNLCVIHKSVSGSSILFRNDLIQVDSEAKKARFRTSSFGTFQLIYCGDSAVAGFSDAGESGASAPPPGVDKSSFSSYGHELTFSLSIPSALRDKTAKYCVIVAAAQSDSDETSMLVVGSGEVSAASYPAVASFQLNTKSIGDEAFTVVKLLAQSSSQSCSFSVGDSFSSEPEYESSYSFLSTKKSLDSGEANGSFGIGPYATSKQTIRVGRRDGQVSTSPPSLLASCISVESKNGAGVTVGGAEINSGIVATKDSEVVVEIPTYGGTGTPDPLIVKIGKLCQSAAANDHGQIYQVVLKTAENDGKYYLSPTHLTLPTSVTTKLAILPEKNVCVELYDGNFTSSNSASSNPANSLGRWTLTDVGLDIYAPWDTSKQAAVGTAPVYDLLFHLASDCTSNFPAAIAVTANDADLFN